MKKPVKGKQQAPKTIDIAQLTNSLRSQVDKNLQSIFDLSVVSGIRIMFDRSSHASALAELSKPGPMAEKLANGAIQVTYLLWTQSNKSLPPKIIVPLGQMFVLKAFQFLQLSEDKEATREVLGDAYANVTKGILDRAGATEDRLPALLQGMQGKKMPTTGMLAAQQGGAQ